MKYTLPKPTLIGTLPAFGTYYHQVYGYTEDEVKELIENITNMVKKECVEICLSEARQWESLDKNGRSVYLDYAEVAKTCAAAIMKKIPISP